MALIIFPKGHRYAGYAADPVAQHVYSYKRNPTGDRMLGNSQGYFKINGVSIHKSAIMTEARAYFAKKNNMVQSSGLKLTVDAVAVSAADKSSQFISKGTSVSEVEELLSKRKMLMLDDLLLLDATTGAKIPFSVTRTIKLG